MEEKLSALECGNTMIMNKLTEIQNRQRDNTISESVKWRS